MSVVEHVDKMVIAYSMMPSQGHGTLLTCPDSEGYIFSICQDVLKDKLIWDRADRYGAENEHRSVKYRYSEGYDLVFTVDSDEVYKTDELQKSFKYAYWGVDRFYGVDGFVNFWRSFDYACYDGFRPIRLENLHRKEHTQDLNLKQTIYHFSTCQPEPIMRYKYNVFGHAHEVRKDWLNDIYYKWKPNNQFDDVHCVAFNLWNPVPFDKSVLPSYLKSHHNYNKVLV
jgi:hypothetical protein